MQKDLSRHISEITILLYLEWTLHLVNDSDFDYRIFVHVQAILNVKLYSKYCQLVSYYRYLCLIGIFVFHIRTSIIQLIIHQNYDEQKGCLDRATKQMDESKLGISRWRSKMKLTICRKKKCFVWVVFFLASWHPFNLLYDCLIPSLHYNNSMSFKLLDIYRMIRWMRS